MTQFFLFFLLLLNSLLFMIFNHPLSLGLSLMVQTLLISLFSGIFTMMFWFSYSLFLIFMGGMLILFMYMTSIASNETFKFTFNLNFFWLLLMFFFLLIYLFNTDFKNIFLNNKMKNFECNSIWMLNLNLNFNSWMLNKMFNFPTNLITIMLVNYLFLTLIAAVKITNMYSGPLRPKIF